MFKGDISDQEMIQHHENYEFKPRSSFPETWNEKGVFWLKWIFKDQEISSLSSPSIYLENFSDSEIVYLNGQKIGSKGIFGEKKYYLPHSTSFYEILQHEKSNVLLIKVYRENSFYFYALGKFIEKPEFINIEEAEKKFLEHRKKRSIAYFIIGLILIFSGSIFCILHFFSKGLSEKILIGISTVFFGLHGVFFSGLLYEYFHNFLNILKIHCITIILCFYTIFSWFLANIGFLKSTYKNIIFYICIVYCIIISLHQDFDQIIRIYFSWYVVLIISCVFLIYKIFGFIFRGIFKTDHIFFLLCIILSLIECILTYNSVEHRDIATYGFMSFFLLTIGSLTRDFSNSYREIESEVKRRSQDLAQYAEKLILSDREKSRYLSHLMHDLRSPLTAIGSILRHQLPQSQDKELISQTAKRIDVLTQQIHDYQNLKITDSSVRKQKNVATIRTQETFSTLLLADLEKCLSEKKSKHLFL
ncbi:MAG: HAMP domain-containing histidine kinase, partial [Bdellovibrionales bacterium]|nr:HAMP domain-containing histidine kinase [Bdellovibrionales bacterium]